MNMLRSLSVALVACLMTAALFAPGSTVAAESPGDDLHSVGIVLGRELQVEFLNMEQTGSTVELTQPSPIGPQAICQGTATLIHSKYTAPNIQYRAQLGCLTARSDRSIKVSLQAQDMNGSGWYDIPGHSSLLTECRWGFLCFTPTRSYDASSYKSRRIRVVAWISFSSTSSKMADSEWYFNNRGRGYPRMWAGSAGEVRFPSNTGPWGPNRSLYGDRDGFNRKCDALYAANRWAIPPNGEHHHIHPLEFGGSDNGYTNCVILPAYMHADFTDWWRAFNP